MSIKHRLRALWRAATNNEPHANLNAGEGVSAHSTTVACHCGAAKEIAELKRTLLQHQIAAKWDVLQALHKQMPLSDMLSCALCQYQARRSEFASFVSHCIFGGGELQRYQCPACDVIFGTEQMLALDKEALSQEYEWHYQVYEEGDSTEQEIRAFHALEPQRDKVYINWGAGSWSQSVARLRAEGWQVFGYEPHGSAASTDEGTVSTLAEVAALAPSGIYTNNVLEHFRYPAEALSAMADLLPAGGRMSHATPCFAYRFEFTRFHLFFFLGRSRGLLRHELGLNELAYHVDGDFMNWVLEKP